MNERIRRLMEQRASIITRQRAMLAVADDEERNLTQEEENTYSAFDADFEKINASIAREERLVAKEMELSAIANANDNPQRNRQPGSMEVRNEKPNATNEYRNAALSYMVNGSVGNGLILDGVGEKRAILGVSLTGTGATGGVLAPAQMEKALLDSITQQNVIRSLADVRTSTSDVDIPYASTHTTAYLVAEGDAFTASTPAFAKHTMSAYKVGALSYVTIEAMADMFVDMEAWVRDDFAQAFADLEETHFLKGTGSGAPSGILTDSVAGVTAAGTTAITADEILHLIYSVAPKYRKNGKFVMNDATILLLRKLKDQNNQYLWQPSFKEGEPDRLFGYPIYTSDVMDTAAATKQPILFGDFKKFRILDRAGLYFQRLNEIAATSGQVAFLAYRRYDSKLLDSNAVKNLTMAAS